ncbi:hypothetical protein FLA4_09670 [Candidatus Rickettsia kotlanii]|nr:hypothetical protein FLA4_09670 [Candidatus Rickettsia kotlanii]BDU61800.1 hypothetical protein HM2_09680 [Candidatus Rickettsia kotlanii]
METAANASESAKKTFLASEYSKAAVRLSVISNVTISYFNLLALDKQIYLAEFDIDNITSTNSNISDLSNKTSS